MSEDKVISEKVKSLFLKYNNKVYNLAYRMTGSREDAQDILQETFIKVMKSLPDFRSESQAYTWMYRITANNCLRFLEKKKKGSFIGIKELAEINSSPVSEEITETEKLNYILQVKDGCLSGLLRCLSLQQRLAFILNVLLNLSQSIVAEVIGKSENATRILIHRAKQNIQDYLCVNCSLYNSKNPCRCENLINFSLRKGWIGSTQEDISIIEQAENEITTFKNIINLYKTLPEVNPDKNESHQIKDLLVQKKDYLIFQDKKVK